jgi:hypothetical protein
VNTLHKGDDDDDDDDDDNNNNNNLTRSGENSLDVNWPGAVVEAPDVPVVLIYFKRFFE